MFSKLMMVLKIPELRNKILLTLALLLVFRLGSFIPLPLLDQEAAKVGFEELKKSNQGLGQALKIVEMFSASAFGMATIFGMGIMPYISASIIFQLLASVYPPLEKLQKEGEGGRKKINEYTRYATVFLAFFQSYFWISNGLPQSYFHELSPFHFFFARVVMAVTMTAGTVLLMWIGEQIDEYGIGNGISLLIMAGILSRMPGALFSLLEPAMRDGVALGSERGIDKLLLLAIMFIAVIVGVIAMTQAQRRIPTQSAKHQRGRRVWGGTRQYLPLKVNQSGVMPIIFASSLLLLPGFVFSQIANYTGWSIFEQLNGAFGQERGFVYNICYVGLIYFFCYFWTALVFNPTDIANNLRDYGSFIPGHRPGKRTADYLEKVMVRITYVGAAFLALVAVIPSLIQGLMNIDFVVASFFGGTGLLIVVSVGLDLVQKIDNYLVMRNYAGLLED
jgi:preprotein translocase subunit SecY